MTASRTTQAVGLTALAGALILASCQPQREAEKEATRAETELGDKERAARKLIARDLDELTLLERRAYDRALALGLRSALDTKQKVLKDTETLRTRAKGPDDAKDALDDELGELRDSIAETENDLKACEAQGKK
jgi:hypothetical protein